MQAELRPSCKAPKAKKLGKPGRLAGYASVLLPFLCEMAFSFLPLKELKLLKATMVVIACVTILAFPDSANAQAALTYRQALDIALARNLELQAARRQRAIREADVLTAGLRPNPDFSMEVSRDTPHEVFSLDIPLELGGKRARRLALAREGLTLSDIDERQAVRDLVRDLRRTFYGVFAADGRSQLASESVQVAERVLQVAKERFQAGDTPRLDVIQAEFGVARAQADLDLARSSRATALADLNTILNQAATQPVAVSGSLLDAPANLTFEHAMELAGRLNIDLLTAEREAAIEARHLDLLRAERIPTPTFSVGAVVDAPGEFTAGPRAGFTLPLPLFNRNQGEIARSGAVIEQLRAHSEALRRSVENRVFAAVARIQAQRQQVETYQNRLIPAANSLEQLAEESYRLGRSPVLGVLDAQRSLRDVKREYLQVQLDYQMAIADLEEIVGGRLD